MAPKPQSSIGARIRQRRQEADVSLSRLSELAQVSKGYLWSLEQGKTNARPSGDTLYRIAAALGTTMSDLLGRTLLVDQPELDDLPPGLAEFAHDANLPEKDIAMLSAVNFRGEQPRDAESWQFVYRAIQMSVNRDVARARVPAARAPKQTRRRRAS
jgi:transcriptional regulator with XRE-family HTH domain